MSWLEKFKDAVLVDEPGGQAAPAPAGTKAPVGGFTVMGTAPVQPAGVNPEFLAAIKKVVMARNTAMTQLLAAADRLANIIPDATTRFKAAAATASDGRTVPQILAAVDIHLQDVDGEEARFKAAINAKMTTEVGALEGTANSLRTMIEAAQNEMQAAQNRIQELSQRVATANNELLDAQNAAAAKRGEIEQLQLQFAAAANVVRQELTAHKSTIQSALS